MHARECVCVCAQMCAQLGALCMCAGSRCVVPLRADSVSRLLPPAALLVSALSSCTAQHRRLGQSDYEPSEQEQAAGLALERAGTSAPGSRASGRERAARTRSWCAGHAAASSPRSFILRFWLFPGASQGGSCKVSRARSSRLWRCASPGPRRHGEKNGRASPAPAVQNCAPAPKHTALLVLINLLSLSRLHVINSKAELYLTKAFSTYQHASATQLQTHEVWNREVCPAQHSYLGTEGPQGALV